MALRVYNTLTRQKEDFETIEPGKVRMYCCGPTVYDYLHIGNFRGAVFYNMVRRWLQHHDYEVTFVYNFTDVDDKILKRAEEESTTPKEIADKYIEEFKKDFSALKLDPHDHNPRVTEYMGDIVTFIENLVEKGKAYAAGGEVFFAVESFDNYGQLSNRKIDELLTGVRIEVDAKKRHAADFTLWKPAKPGEQSWPSPWGAGRPGWHIECSCMSTALLGDQIDLHGGGNDLVFPHHENEIAQSEAASGKTYSRYWMHNNMINFSGAKMSKSLGNIRTMRSFLNDYHGELFKYLILSSHYRSESDFSEVTVQQAISGVAKFYTALKKADEMKASANTDHASPMVEEFQALVQKAEGAITTALDDDFNTPKVFAELFDILKYYNQKTPTQGKRTADMKTLSLLFSEFVKKTGAWLGLLQEQPAEFLQELKSMLIKQKGIDVEQVQSLIDERQEARANKNYDRADEIRKELESIEVEVYDAPGGTEWSVIH